MKSLFIRSSLGLAILLVLLGHSLGSFRIEFIDRLDAIFYDTKLRLTMPKGIDERIVILDIDEKSLAEIGRWPWGRDKLAGLLDILFDVYGVSLVGFDMVFAEPDASSGLPILESLAQGQLKDQPEFQSTLRELRTQLDFDARFASAMKGRPVVLGYYFSEDSHTFGKGVLPPPTLAEGSFRGHAQDLVYSKAFGGNLAELQRNAVGGGHFTHIADADGILRRVPMLIAFDGQYYESLSLAIVRALLGNPRVTPGFAKDDFFSARNGSRVEWLDLPLEHGEVRIPVDEVLATYIPYRGPQGSFPYISISDVLAMRVTPEVLAGRIVLVGTSAATLKDLRATPVGAYYSGVEVHANLVAGILDHALKRRPANVTGLTVLLLTLTGAIMIFGLPRISPLWATAATALLAGLLIVANVAFWQMGNLIVPLAACLLLVALLYALNMFLGYFVESRAKRQITGLFGQYVPPELVDVMARNPESYSMASRQAELTVLFSDIRGFTSISENMPPDQLSALMNEYLGAMTTHIRHYRGTLDKYIGDAIMAFWGAPVNDPEHAFHAVCAALAMRAALPELNRSLVARGWPELRFGIGINTGVMKVGDMGSPVRLAYTVLGDAVNLASRLEGITREYGVEIIVGQRTRDMLQDRIVFRELDRVRVQGKETPEAIFQPIGPIDEVSQATISELNLWEQMLRFYRAGEWTQAQAVLTTLAERAPKALYVRYSQRITYCRTRIPSTDWDGIWNFEHK